MRGSASRTAILSSIWDAQLNTPLRRSIKFHSPLLQSNMRLMVKNIRDFTNLSSTLPQMVELWLPIWRLIIHNGAKFDLVTRQLLSPSVMPKWQTGIGSATYDTAERKMHLLFICPTNLFDLKESEWTIYIQASYIYEGWKCPNVKTVNENKIFYMQFQFERAKQARDLNHALGTPLIY